jgi:FixJ family two-component response regulator
MSTAHATMSRSVCARIQMGSQDSIVYVVDDDVRICEALRELFTSLNIASVTFGSVAEYIAYTKPDLPACLILDVKLPDINGLDFQRQLGDAYHPPIVFITGHGDIPSLVRAIKAGAVDFLSKPLSQPDLMTAIDAAITRDRHARLERAQRTRLQEHYASLTPRESQVLPLIVGGLLNKQAAGGAWHQRSHAPNSSKPDYAENGGGVLRRSCSNGRAVADPARAPEAAMTWRIPSDLWWPSLTTTIALESLADFAGGGWLRCSFVLVGHGALRTRWLVRHRLFDLRHRHARYEWS